MAKLINPLLSQDARGSVAGLQFSRNTSGAFGSRKSTTSRKQSLTATNHRAQIKRAHTFWDSLGDAVKQGWEAVAHPPMNGRNAFVGAAIRNLTMNENPPNLNPMAFNSPNHIYDLKWDAFGHGSGDGVITWQFTDWEETWVMAYIRNPRGTSMPHVRQFRYHARAEELTAILVIGQVFIRNLAAVRLVHVHHEYGRVMQEFRLLFDPSQDQDFDLCDV